MKAHRILKDFNGSQTGNDFRAFKAGEVADLSDDLARIAVGEGWAELATQKPNTAVERETKVTGPEETKPFDITTLDEKALVKFAKDSFKLKLDPKLSKDELLAAIEAHTAEKTAA